MADLPAHRMRAAGIVQEGDPVLRRRARPFTLPAEEQEARRVLDLLRQAMDRVAKLHHFAKGMGLAAPQLGISRAAAVIRPAAAPEIVLLNPRIVAASEDQDLRYEGCLSFFNVRGELSRPVTITVAHHHLNGTATTTTFTTGLARHAQHEIDHLEGRLYTDHMPPGTTPIPLSQYRDSGHPWT